MVKPPATDEEKIRKKMKFIETFGLQSWSDYEAYARCLKYYGNHEKAASLFVEAAVLIEKLISIKSERNPAEAARVKMVQANYYRLAGDRSKCLDLYRIVLPELESLLPAEESSDPVRHAHIFSRLSFCLYFLEQYEQSLDYGSKVPDWEPASAGYAQAILERSPKKVESVLKKVAAEIRKEKLQPYSTGSEVSLWDWHEIGTKLLNAFD